MSTSNSIDFAMNRNDICLAALRTAGILGVEQAVCPASILVLAEQKLNQLVKHWENAGYHIWTRAHATLFLVPGQAVYSLGAGSTDRCASSFAQTALTVSAVATATTITVASTTGITIGDNIGICLDAGTTQWTTVSNVNTSTLVVTLGAGLTSAASVGAVVFDYLNTIQRPMRVESATIRNSALIDRMLGEPVGREDYFNFPIKSVSGTVTSFYYDQQPTGNSGLGALYVYLPPSVCYETLQMEYVRSIQDFDTATDGADIPQRWLLALEYNLAVLLCSAFGKETKKQSLHLEAAQYLSDANGSDFESATVNIIPSGNY